jgi:hypothetical protein
VTSERVVKGREREGGREWKGKGLASRDSEGERAKRTRRWQVVRGRKKD